MNNLEQRILKLERLLLEGKSVGTLYHVCTVEALAEYIAPTNTLQGSGKYINKLLGTRDIVSFTRNKNFVVGTDTVETATILFQFEVDGDKLSDKYKITPYDDFWSYSGVTEPTNLEQEEVVRGKIKNFKSYIKCVNFDLTDNFFDREFIDINGIDINELIENIKVVKKYLSGIEVKRSNLPFSGFKKKKYNYKFKTLDDVIEFLENFRETDDDDYSLNAQSDNQNGNDIEILKYAQDIPSVKKALKLGANINVAGNPKADLPLEKAIRLNNIKLAKFLIANGASYNHNMIDKLVSRITTIYDDNFADTLMFLIDDLGADISDNEKASQEYIKICYKQGRETDIINYIKSIKDLTICTQLFLFFIKDLEIVKLFIKAGVDPLAKGYGFGIRLLDRAAIYPKSFEFIIKNSDIKKSVLNELLFMVVENNQFEYFKILLKNGANPNCKSEDDQSILDFVIFQNNGNEHKYVAELIKAGADVNLKSYDKLPICDAAERPTYYNKEVTIKIISTLCKAGADITKVDLENVTVPAVKNTIKSMLS